MSKLTSLRGHTIFQPSLKLGSFVLDCGTHRGEFASEILQAESLTVHGFEANPNLFRVLPTLENTRFFHKAVGGEIGTVTFNLQEPERGSIRFVGNEESTVLVASTTLEEHCIVERIERVGLLKLDIEGAELDVLENASSEFLSRVDQITVEFHDFLCKEDLPRIKACVSRLKSSGFYFIRMSFFTWGDCLLLNRRTVHLSLMDKLAITYYKYSSGANRLCKKMIAKLTPTP